MPVAAISISFTRSHSHNIYIFYRVFMHICVCVVWIQLCELWREIVWIINILAYIVMPHAQHSNLALCSQQHCACVRVAFRFIHWNYGPFYIYLLAELNSILVVYASIRSQFRNHQRDLNLIVVIVSFRLIESYRMLEHHIYVALENHLICSMNYKI